MLVETLNPASLDMEWCLFAMEKLSWSLASHDMRLSFKPSNYSPKFLLTYKTAANNCVFIEIQK